MTSPRRMLRTIESVNAAGLPAVLTVHPWEIDPEPPRVSLPPRLRFAHYFRLGGFRERLAAHPVGRRFRRVVGRSGAAGVTMSVGLPVSGDCERPGSGSCCRVRDSHRCAARAGAGRPTASSNCHRRADLGSASGDRFCAPRCRSLTWSGWPAPSTIARSKSGWPLTSLARCLCGWRSTAPATVDGVEPWRAGAAGPVDAPSRRHRDPGDRGWRRLEARHVCDQTGLYRSAVCARVDTGRAQWLAAVVTRCARRSLHVRARAVCRSPGASGDGRPAAASAHLLKVDPDARLAILAGDAGDEPEAVARRLIDSQLETVGTDVAIVAWRSSGLIQPALRQARTDRAASRRRHHGARRPGGRPGAVACRPRRHEFDATSAALRQPDVRDIPGLLGRRLGNPARRDAHPAG